ncbi:MAG: aminotransferase class IV family protein [Anaerolineae bacterium]|nr:aminotransferase class IV family protein [Anaerolineae bacterium]
MTIPTFILTADGLVPAPFAVDSLAEAIAHEPQGVYTVTRTFRGDYALLLDAHLDRLEESARLVDIPLVLDRARLRAALREMLHNAGYPDAKFRITVPREQPDLLYLSLEPYQPVPDDVQTHGAHVITVPLARQNPVAKTTDWMTIRKPAYSSLPSGVYEGILVDPEGRILEGLSSNFYGVLDGVLRTAGEDILAGIVRRAVLQIAADVVPVELTALHVDDIGQLSEAFMTSSGRGVVPITMINGQPVASGHIGPVTGEIRRQYNVWTETHIEPI